jgi:hypothetical protein
MELGMDADLRGDWAFLFLDSTLLFTALITGGGGVISAFAMMVATESMSSGFLSWFIIMVTSGRVKYGDSKRMVKSPLESESSVMGGVLWQIYEPIRMLKNENITNGIWV